jgi:hypothetical protein
LEFVQQPDAIRSLFLRPGNSNALAELRELRGLSPELKTGLRQEMLALYRRATLDANGNFQREAANRFLNEYRSHLKLLFGDRADDLISIQRMATEATRLENRAKTVQTAVRETFGQKWASNATTPDEVVRELMSGKFQEEQISRFASRVRRADPQLWEDIQQQGLRWIENYTTTGKSGQEINWRGLDRLLQGSNRDKLVTMYGAKYVDNLGTIRDVARRVAGETMGETFATNVQSPLLQVSRSLLGPLSKKQRFITSTNRLMKAMGNAHFRKMMAQPDALDQWIKINRPEPGTFAAASALMEAPGYMWDAADDETRELAEKIRAARATRQFSSQPTGQ